MTVAMGVTKGKASSVQIPLTTYTGGGAIIPGSMSMDAINAAINQEVDKSGREVRSSSDKSARGASLVIKRQ